MDDADYAQERQEQELRRLITARVYALPKGESAKNCKECGEPIPEKRRMAMPGCRYCRECQEAFERGRR